MTKMKKRLLAAAFILGLLGAGTGVAIKTQEVEVAGLPTLHSVSNDTLVTPTGLPTLH